METRSFNSLVEEFLGARLPASLADNIAFPELSSDAGGVILRMLALMKRSSYPATEFNSHMIWLLSTVTPGMLPSAWQGKIPPLTSPGRHRKLDAYVTQQIRSSHNEKPVFIDLGCGFPPVTTMDTALYLPGWSVLGVDCSFACHVIYNSQGHYACFNRDGEFQYFQSQMKPLHDTPESVRAQFKLLFEDLFPQLKGMGDQTSETVEKDGNRLVYNHIRDFETNNLKFIESDIEGLQLTSARVIRCMNVLLYFEKSARDRMRSLIGARLDDSGILICGFNHPFGIYARYAVYKKDATGIWPCEFAFSPDNLRPLGIGPWLTIRDKDEEAELLADLTGAIRSDKAFWAQFNHRVDTLQEKHGICSRGDDGFHHFMDETQTALSNGVMEKTRQLWHELELTGYTDGVVEALNRAGYKAWKNPVGDIAVFPPKGSLPMIYQ